MILLVDAGNTCLKWRLFDDRIVAAGRLKNDAVATLAEQVSTYGAPMRMAVSCVARPEIIADLNKLADKWGIKLCIAATLPQQCGVTCGYSEHQQMGVDRWLAVIAAFAQYQACVVVDAGSAITVDLVDEHGNHRGGYIVPGFGKMRHSLFQGTSQVKVTSLGVGEKQLLPGISTEQAVSHGLYAMVSGLIDKSLELLGQESDGVRLVITGGDAALVKSLGFAGTVVENLVLDGLALVLEDGRGEACLTCWPGSGDPPTIPG